MLSPAECTHLLRMPGQSCPACGATWIAALVDPIADRAMVLYETLSKMNARDARIAAEREADIYDDELDDVLAQEERERSEEDLVEADRIACTRSLAEFCKLAWLVRHPTTKLEWSWHHDALCDHFQWMIECWIRAQADPTYVQPFKNTVFNLCPSSLKTELIMEFAPAWVWLRYPSWRVLCVSCNPKVALISAVNSREVIESAWYQTTFRPTWTLRDDQNTKSNFANSDGGGRISQGMGAAVVGIHGDAVLVDDPTDPQAITQENLDQVASDWPSLSNRVNDPRTSMVFAIQQRLDPQDFTGRCTDDTWLKIEIPLLAELDPRKVEQVSAAADVTDQVRACETPMPVNANNRLDLRVVRGEQPGRFKWRDPRKKVGEAVIPARYPAYVIADLERKAGPYGWAAQYQQRPVSREGQTVKRQWWQFFRADGHIFGTRPRPAGCVGGPGWPASQPVPPVYELGKGIRGNRWDLDWMAISLDAANKETENGSLWGTLAVGGKGQRRFIFDDGSRRGELHEILEMLRAMMLQWRPRVLLVEDKAAGPTVVATLRRELAEGLIKDADGKPISLVVVSWNKPGDKFFRLRGVLPQIYQGLVYLPEGAPWVDAFVEELSLFPKGPTNDRVDALSQLLDWAADTTATSTLYTMSAEQWATALQAMG